MLALIGVAVVVLYHVFGVTDIGYDPNRVTHSIFAWLADRWRTDFKDTFYANSHYIPFVTIALIWLKRKELAAVKSGPWWPGLLVVALALAMHWAGSKSQQTRLSLLSLILLLWSIPLTLYGRRFGRILLFPCAFLVFSLPLNFFDSATYPVRILAARFSAAILGGFGIPVTARGSLLAAAEEGGFRLDTADSTSGIFALTAVVALTVAVAWLTQRSVIRFVILSMLAIPVAFLANVTRIVIVGVTATAVGPGFTETTAHATLSGLSFLVSSVAYLAALVSLMRSDWRAWFDRLKAMFKPVDTIT